MKFAILILNWNSYKDSIECISSILNNDYKNFNIFLLDNGSSNKDYDILRNKFSENKNVKVLSSKRNLGFAGGHNYLCSKIRSQKFDYIFLLNNDTILRSDFLKEMYSSIKKFEKTQFKLFVPTIYYYNKDLKEKVLWRANDHKKVSSQESRVKYPTGCAVIIKSQLIKKYGLFKPEFFAYAEELEYFYRLSKIGVNVLYVPKAVMWHKIVEFTDSPFKIYMSIRNKWYYWSLRNSFDKIPYLFYMCLFYLPKKLITYSKNKSNLNYFFKGNRDGISWIAKGIKPRNPFIIE